MKGTNPWELTPDIAWKYAYAIEQLETAPVEQRRLIISSVREVESDEVIPVLLKAINNTDRQVRLTALGAFWEAAGVGKKAPASFFLPLLDDPDRDVAGNALAATRYSGDKRACDSLLKRMQAADGQVKVELACTLCILGDRRGYEVVAAEAARYGGDAPQHYVIALGACGDSRAYDQLIASLKARDSANRQAAAGWLGKLGDKRAVPALIENLGGDYATATSAATALGDLGDVTAVEPLCKALDGSAPVAAASALGKLGDPRAIKPLIASLEHDSHTAQAALAALAPKQPQTVIDALSSPNARVRYHCALALGLSGQKAALPALLDLLRKDDPASEDAVAAATALGELKDRGAVDALIGVLKASRNARWAAAKALGTIGDGRAIDPLIDAMMTDKEDGCTPGVAAEQKLGALAMIGQPAEPKLLLRLQDPKSPNRYVIVEAIGRVKGKSAVPALVPLITGEITRDQEYLARAAVIALGEIGDRRAVAPLAALANGHRFYYQAEVAAALAKIGGSDAVEALLSNYAAVPREGFAAALAAVGERRAIPLMMNVMKTHSSFRLTDEAAGALASMNAREAVGPMAEAMAKYNSTGMAQALGRIGGKEAVEAVIAARRQNPGCPAYLALRPLGVPGYWGQK